MALEVGGTGGCSRWLTHANGCLVGSVTKEEVCTTLDELLWNKASGLLCLEGSTGSLCRRVCFLKQRGGDRGDRKKENPTSFPKEALGAEVR